jgi:UV DNA damage endonuclease
MRLGYACVNTELPSSGRTVRLANATPERLCEVIAGNLDALDAILRWNAEHGVLVFRLTSDLIPFGSHPVNRLAWWDEFGEQFAALAALIRSTGARLSTHPGQYTVLSSARAEVAEAAVAELVYHDRMMRALGLDASHKIVLHIGSGSGDPAAAERMCAAAAGLPDGPRSRLVLENDERWPLADVLEIAGRIELPVVFDAFHHSLAPSFQGEPVRDAVQRAAATWSAADGRQDVHFSTQAEGRRPGAHADSLDLDAFAGFARAVADLPLDCVLEVKDKECSLLRALPVLQATRQGAPHPA